MPAYLRRHAPDAFIRQSSVQGVIKTLQAEHPHTALRPLPPYYRPPAVAIDVPSLFYRVMYSATDTASGIFAFLSMFQPLRDAGIRLVFVFDNPRKPNKGPERERRRAKANADRKRLQELRCALAEAEKGPTPDQDVGEWMHEMRTNQETLDKVAKRIDVVKPRDFVMLNLILTAMGYITLLAKDEGEAAAAHLDKERQVDAVISDDFDVLALGVRCFIRNFGNYGGYSRCCEVVYLSKALTSISLPYPAFLQMCVLCGSDFTEHLHGMGPAKARKVLGMYKSLGTYFASSEYQSTYGSGAPFAWRVALDQFQNTVAPVLSLPAILRILCLLLSRLSRK